MSPPRRFLQVVLFSYCLLSMVPVAPSTAAQSTGPALVGQSDVVSRFGITWRFSEHAITGSFVTGDPWVVGPVTVVEIAPAPTGRRHGSMVNPDFSPFQGYDDRHHSFRPELMARPPLRLEAGDVLISTISRATKAPGPHVMSKELPRHDSIALVDSAAILTVVDSPPPPTAFRPPYCGPRRIFDSADLRWERLPRLSLPEVVPEVAFWERVFDRPWIDHVAHSWEGRLFHPRNNMPDYGREMSQAASIASLLLGSDLTRWSKEPLLHSFVQWGIDVWGMASVAGPDGGWEAMGGHGNGGKWPMLFAGLLLGEEEILHTRALFSEDQQTYYGPGWNGAQALFRWHHRSYPERDWHYEELPPESWTNLLGEEYRRCCTGVSWHGTALIALAMDARSSWNHDAFFDYVDRWMEVPDVEDRARLRAALGQDYVDYWNYHAQAGSGSRFGEGTTLSDFAMWMWRQHRQGIEDSSDDKQPEVELLP